MFKTFCLVLLFAAKVQAAPCNLFVLIRETDIDGVAACLNTGGATLANTAATSPPRPRSNLDIISPLRLVFKLSAARLCASGRRNQYQTRRRHLQ